MSAETTREPMKEHDNGSSHGDMPPASLKDASPTKPSSETIVFRVSQHNNHPKARDKSHDDGMRKKDQPLEPTPWVANDQNRDPGASPAGLRGHRADVAMIYPTDTAHAVTQTSDHSTPAMPRLVEEKSQHGDSDRELDELERRQDILEHIMDHFHSLKLSSGAGRGSAGTTAPRGPPSQSTRHLERTRSAATRAAAGVTSWLSRRCNDFNLHASRSPRELTRGLDDIEFECVAGTEEADCPTPTGHAQTYGAGLPQTNQMQGFPGFIGASKAYGWQSATPMSSGMVDTEWPAQPTIPNTGFPVKSAGNGEQQKPSSNQWQPMETSGNNVLHLGKRLACPFFKHSPQKYAHVGACTGPGWYKTHRLKEHLYRDHRLPPLCPRCGDEFSTIRDLNVHIKSKTPCQVQSGQAREGVTPEQEKLLRSRKRGKGAAANLTEEAKWIKIYHILFPEDDLRTIPSPYYDMSSSQSDSSSQKAQQAEPGQISGTKGSNYPVELRTRSTVDEYEDFLGKQLPTHVHQEFWWRIDSAFTDTGVSMVLDASGADLEARLKQQLCLMFESILHELVQEFKRTRAGDYGNSAPTPTPIPQKLHPPPPHNSIPVLPSKSEQPTYGLGYAQQAPQNTNFASSGALPNCVPIHGHTANTTAGAFGFAAPDTRHGYPAPAHVSSQQSQRHQQYQEQLSPYSQWRGDDAAMILQPGPGGFMGRGPVMNSLYSMKEDGSSLAYGEIPPNLFQARAGKYS